MDLLLTLQEIVLEPVFVYFFIFCSAVSFITWIETLRTGNYSQVDRIWSIAPPVYAWGFLFSAIYLKNANFPTIVRISIVTIFATLWGIRLTYNFWRKGGYNPANEDYRWIYVQKIFNYPESKFIYHVFNFVFTAFLQNYLLMGLVVPLWFIQSNKGNNEQLNIYDLIVSVSLFGFFAIEVIADQQQWNYQTSKYDWIEKSKTKKPINYSQEEIENFKRGFLINGLFKYSRHPNFFAEMSIWWCVYLFTLTSQFSKLNFTAASLVNYSIFGTLFLTSLFQGSTWLTEKITSGKYPEYTAYKSKVSRFFPLFGTYEPKRSK